MISQRVSNPDLLLALMKLRNEVRSFMTGSQDAIIWENQIKWFSELDHDLVKIWLYGEENGKWLGYGQLRIEPGNISYGVTTHAVTSSARGMGYGQKILKHLIEMAKDSGCNYMRAEIFKTNAASLGLVHKLGYVDTEDLGDAVEVKLPL
jgi:L-amino acid N-acyltransferase YncA